MLNDDSSSSLGGIGNILGQFGLGMGSSESNLDKIIELSRTRTISQSALFHEVVLRGSEDYLANHLIASLEEHNAWTRKSLLPFGGKDGLDLEGFRFRHDSLGVFTILENKALKKLYNYLVGKERVGAAFRSDYSELSGIMNFHISTFDPELSIQLVNQLYDDLSEYYISRSAEKQEYDFKLIKSKYDSINTRLNSVQYSIAKFEDQSQGLYRKQDLLREKQLKVEEMKLVTMMGEAEKQLQIARLAVENNFAYIQLIDRPILPLKPVNKGAFYYFLLGGLLGGVCSILYVITKKMYLDILTN